MDETQVHDLKPRSRDVTDGLEKTAARGMLRAADKGRGEVYLPGFWRLIMFIIRSIPEGVFKRMKL